MYSNAQFCAERMLWTGTVFQTLGPGNVSLAALPLFHSFGQTCNQNATLFAGGALTYLERFDPESALRVMERDRVTLFAGVPTMYFQLLNFPDAEKYDLASLRYCSSGGAAMPAGSAQRLGGPTLAARGALKESSPATRSAPR